MQPPLVNKQKPKVILLSLSAVIATAAMLFLPAGSVYYWQAWVFLAILFIPCFFVLRYFWIHNPEFLAKRMQFREKEKRQHILVVVAQLGFLLGFLTPGLDYRYGWTSVPLWLTITADILFFACYMFIFWVFRVNAFASRIVEVVPDQKVISSGPYAIIRHPMYAGLIPMYLSVPLMLGSFVAVFIFLPVIPVMILRIFDEEKLLLRDLPGYREYTQKVRYRLIPGVW